MKDETDSVTLDWVEPAAPTTTIPRPDPLPVNPDHIPDALKALNQWVVWAYRWKETHWTKPPLQANGQPAKTNDPTTWTSFERALDAYQTGRFDGVGIAFSDSDGLTGLDLDHVFNLATGELDPLASEVLTQFPTYTERSPGGDGLRIFCFGKPKRSGKCSGKRKWLEVYSHPSNRYLTVTGHQWSGSSTEVTGHQPALDRLHSRYMVKTESTEKKAQRSSSVDSIPLDDAALIEKAGKARNGALFAGLWSGDTSGQGGDASSADMALMNILAFWTDRDAARMDRLFRQSGLMRAKWDEIHDPAGNRTYGQMTVDKAIAGTREGYSGMSKDSFQGAGKSSFEIPESAPQPTRKWLTGRELLGMEFPEPNWLLPGILPEVGAFVLAAKPKAGKSWWSLALALAVAQGGAFLGRAVPQGGCLYLALEDTERRLQDRVKKLQPDAVDHPDDFSTLAIVRTAPFIGGGLEEMLRTAISKATTPVRLVVVDTFALVRKPGGGFGSTQYEKDYSDMAALKRVADEMKVCVLVIHHVRKQGADDAHDTVSGTNGIAGAADGTLILNRQRGSDGSAVLSVTGRDVDEAEYGLKFQSGHWEFVGSAQEVRASTEQNELLSALKEYGAEGATVNTLAIDTRKKAQSVRFLLRKLLEKELVAVRRAHPAPFYSLPS